MEFMDSSDMTLGEYLRVARERAGFGTRHLATISGVERSAIVRLEADEMAKPVPDYLVRLADALELNAADLFLLAGLPIPQELPSLAPYLRTKYQLPPDAVAEAEQGIRAILAKYDEKGDE